MGVLYYHLCRTLGLKVLKPWEAIPPVQESDNVRLMWDPSIPTDRVLQERRPDVVLVLKDRREVLLLEFACAFDPLVKEREREKLEKYQELAADVASQYPGYKVRVVPFVIGDLGSIVGLAESLRSLKLFNPRQLGALIDHLQSKVLWGSVRILKRHLVV